jgi:hypothetical protein
MSCKSRYHMNSMRVIPQTRCQIQRTSSSLRYVNCVPCHIQRIYSSAYLDLNIQVKVGPLLLEISRKFNARYTANFEPNTALVLPYTLCELWSRLYTRYLQLRIFRLQYSAAGIIAAFVDIITFQCAIFCRLGAKYSAHPPVYAVWPVIPAIYNALRAPHIQTSLFISR